jgi:SAM-dependent methyltransferase
MARLLASALWLSALVKAFTVVPLTSSSHANCPFSLRTTSVLVSAQRQICEFDASDFALPTGEWPYTAQDLSRLDNSLDSYFYTTPRFVTHIDDRAIHSLTTFYREEMNDLAASKSNLQNINVLDLCSSWISHLPKDLDVPYGKVIGVGMNQPELQANPQLTDYVVQDLNTSPQLQQFEDESFDVICNVVSVDYLSSPREIFQEIHRILRPGGLALMSFSNRCFPTKAVNMWLQADDIGRMTIVASYFHYTAQWKSIEALDILPEKQQRPKPPALQEVLQNPSKGFAWMSAASAVQRGNTGDPMFVVRAVK